MARTFPLLAGLRLRGLDRHRRGRRLAIGILFFGDAATALRIGSAALILAGVVGLEIA
jgi:hypothetical protein